MTMTIHEATVAVLTLALCKIRRGWTQGADARDKDGRMVFHPAHRRCASWCANGALTAASGELGFPTSAAHARLSIGEYALYEWNDAPGRKVEEVIELFERAIAKELEGPSV